MLKYFSALLFIFAANTFSQETNLSQYYSGKFGFYNPSKGLNNGLLFGVDGITEFNNYNFFLSGTIDLYLKKTFNPFEEPQPRITDQQIVVLPIHLNAAYKLFSIDDADTKLYAGIGGGYYLYFYDVTYQNSSGGILGGTISSRSETKNGGDAFFTIFARILIGKVFVEPRYYLMPETRESIPDASDIVLNPSGFSITLGIQY